MVALFAKQGAAPGTSIKLDRKSRALVDVRADVTAKLKKKVQALGGTIVETSAEYRSIVAWIPILKLETLAADPAVRNIQPTPEAEIR